MTAASLPSAPLPTDELDRLEALRSFHILDTRPDPRFDRITDFAARLYDAPIALVSLVDDCRAWFKSRHGIDTPESSRDAAFCAHAIMGGEVFVVEDMLRDERFAEHPLVTNAPHVRFYAGAPITDPNGFRLGTMCIIDFKPREFTAAQRQMLAHMASITYDELELHKALHEISATRQQLSAALQSKSEFFNMMRRELRTPLVSIVNQMESLPTDGLDFNQKRVLSDLHKTAGGLLDVVGDILSYAELETGQIKLEPADFNVSDILESVVGLLRPRAQGCGLTVHVEYRNMALPRLHADPVPIRHILFNLISNAIKFTRAGGVTVEVSTYRGGNDHELRFDVVDTGPGINEAWRAQMMSPDYTPAVQDAGEGGAKLGLPIVHRLLKLTGGRLQISENPVGGTVFSVIFPVRPLATQAATAPRTAVSGSLPALKLLVAEDNQVSQMVLKVALTRLGCSLHFANDGIEAVSAAQREGYDAILMDIQMPEMDGLEATRRIRQLGGDCKTVPIIAITGDAEGRRDELLGKGFTNVVAKPIEIAALLRILQSVKSAA